MKFSTCRKKDLKMVRHLFLLQKYNGHLNSFHLFETQVPKL